MDDRPTTARVDAPPAAAPGAGPAAVPGAPSGAAPGADSGAAPGTSGSVVLRSPEQFKALGHPVRHRMVNALRQRPATLRQLSGALAMSKGTIGYHVRILREAGLVELAETRQVRGGTEQYFALVGKDFRFEEGADSGRLLLSAALAEMLPPRPGQAEHTVLRHLWLTPDEARDLADRIQADAGNPLPNDSSRGEAYGLLVSLFPADVPELAPE